MSLAPLLYAPGGPVTIGDSFQRALKLYAAGLPWFMGWGLAVAAFQAALGAATAGWALLLGLAVMVPMQVGLYAIADATVKGDPISGDTLLRGFRLGPAYALGLLETLLLVGGLLMFVLPMFVVSLALTWSVPFLFRRDRAALNAVIDSAKLTRDHLWLTLGVLCVATCLNLLGTGTVVLGVITLPLMVCLKTVVFEQLTRRG